MSAAKRRRRQAKIGFTHLARICNGSFRGGRPHYKRAQSTVAQAIAREQAQMRRENERKARKAAKK